MWDFAGQHVYHATHEMFFTPQALYIFVWDMGVSKKETWEKGHFGKPKELAVTALRDEKDENVQFWVECIQSNAPGVAILPVASFAR